MVATIFKVVRLSSVREWVGIEYRESLKKRASSEVVSTRMGEVAN